MIEEDIKSTRNDVITNSDGSITLDDITIPPAPTPALTIDASKERLIITELLVRDFKSYAGTHTIGPFNKNFSCIVGPNGSGKSNVIDALLFVFGYRAQKIRSKKVSVLIHKSHKFPDLNSCSVTVNFAMIKDEGALHNILPDSQFSVTRTGFTDNSSVYEVNGRRSQYKDVSNLLKSYSIDLDYNRFMILQGEIELISMMKPKSVTEQDPGMLEYIEDIIGSNRFIKPIQHFQTKMDEENEKRLEKLNHLKIVKKERAEAEKPRNKAMEYLDLANKLVLLENSVFQAEIKLASEDGDRLNKKKNDLVEKVKELSTQLEEVQTAKNLKESESRDIISEYGACLKTVEEYKQQFTALEHTDAACRENIKHNKEKIKKLTKNLETEETKISKLRKQPEMHRGEISELEEKKKKIETVKIVEEEKLTEVMGSMKNEIQGFQEEKDSLEGELVGLQSIVNQQKSELDLVQSELDLCLSSERKEKEKLCNLQNEYDKVSSSIVEEEKAIKKASERLPEIESKLKSAKEELVEKEKDEAVFNEQLKNLRIKHDEAVSSLSNSQSRSSLTKAFLQEKKKGNFVGVYGRLGDLGAIDSKFDVAISTACGALDHIVTDTIVTAEECVEFLKQNNLGYTTFIALDKMKKWEPYTQQKISTPENVPRLFDLISVKDKDVLPAFYFALRDTLVANSLEQATRVGLQGSKRYRVVTLKGEVVDLSGTMSGGGGKVVKGRMGQTVTEASASQEEVDQLAKELDTISIKLADVKRTKAELKDIIEQATKEINSLHHSIKKNEMNYDAYVDQKKNLTHQMEEQKKKIIVAEPDKKQVKILQEKINHCKKAYEDAVSAASVIENKVKMIQDQILAVTKGKYGAAQKKIDTLNKEILQFTQNITKSAVLLKNCEKNIKKIEEKVASYKEELEICQKERETYVAEFKSLEVKGAEVSQKKTESEDALKICEFRKMQVAAEIKSFMKTVNQIKSEVLDLKNQVKLVDIEMRANDGQIKTLKSQLSKLELHEIEDNPTELPVLTPEEIDNVPINKVHCKIGNLKNRMKDMNPDLRAIAEFKRKEEIYREKVKDLEATIAERDHYRQHYETLRKLRMQEFMRGFNIITLKVKELYQMMTLGGDAELELVDSLDPFSEGIEYSVRPLRKSWKAVRNLSGGEKTLSSLSLVFALHYYRSTPFFVMDEIDAALDFRNVSIIGSYIKDCTKNAQFIVISLRENMFLLADHLVGIYKTNNRTKNVYLSPPIVTEVADDSITELTKGKKTSDKAQNENIPCKTARVTFRTPEKETSTLLPNANLKDMSLKIVENLSDNVFLPGQIESNNTTNITLSNQKTSNVDITGLNNDSFLINSGTANDNRNSNLDQQDNDSLVIGDEALKEIDSLNENDSFV